MKGYDSYKNSGIRYIGEIPIHWKSLKLKYFVSVITGNTPSTNVDDFFSDEFGIPWVKPSDLNEFNKITTSKQYLTEKGLSQSRLVRKGSVLIGGIGDIGKLGVAGCDITTNQQIHSVEGDIKKVDDEFLKYLLYFSIEELQKNSSSVVLSILTKTKLLDLEVVLPSLEEQTKIAAFLDYKTNLIDATIEKKKRLIELLKEKRQAVINEAVTKGLNPNAKMKDSGVEWLGDFPGNWNIRNFDSTAMKNQYSFTGGPFGSDLKSEEYSDSGVRIIQLQNIGVGVFKDDYKIYTSEEKALQLASCLIFPGDIIIAKMADPVARACIIPNIEEKYIMASDGIRLEVDNKFFNTKFVEYSVNSIYFNSQAEAVSTGTTRLRIGLTVLKKLKILAPPIEEQNLIVEKLMIEELKINSIISKVDTQIQKLQTYRQSLISEAVTGKIDVREWQNPQNN